LVHVEVSDTIDVPKEKLFAFMSDYNNWPKLFPNEHTSVKLIRKEGDLEYLEIGDKRYGRITETHRVIPPNRIEIEEFTPNWIGMFVNLFESASEGGTRLTLKVDIRGRNFLFKLIGPLSKSYIRKRVKKEIHDELKSSVRMISA
jgi:hypothetical protein